MMRMPRSRACRRTSPHCSKKSHCSNSTSRTSRARSWRARARALLLAVDERAVPAAPGRPAVRALQRHEEREVVEPRRVALHERLEGLAPRGRRLLLEGGAGPREEGRLPLDDRPEVHLALREVRPLLQVRRGEEALVAEAIERDEEGVAGEGREALVRRVAVAGGAEGQDLPEALPGLARGNRGTPWPRARARRCRGGRAATWGGAGSRRRAGPRPTRS